MTEIDELAAFYWELYSSLVQRGFEEGQAMKIILKEAKIPRKKSVKTEKSMEDMIHDALSKMGDKNTKKKKP